MAGYPKYRVTYKGTRKKHKYETKKAATNQANMQSGRATRDPVFSSSTPASRIWMNVSCFVRGPRGGVREVR